MPTRRNALVVTDGAAGNVRQATALAAAMRLDATVTEVTWPAPWSWAAPKLSIGAYRTLAPHFRALVDSKRYAMTIGCGRAAALATRVLREQAGFAAVQILDPRADPSHWDVVIAPAHDALAGSNVITTLGSLNPIDDALLMDAGLAMPELAALPSPRTLLAIGGTNRAQRIDQRYIDALFNALPRNGSLLVTLSRRTPRELVRGIAAAVEARHGRLYDPASGSENPYLAFLAHAERIVVTPDSVNLVSEACASGKPVFTFCAHPVAGKLARFHAALKQADHVRELHRIAETWSPVPLRETANVAAQVWARVGEKLERIAPV
jgi:mitochondrial fission protein ELM1